MHHKPLRWLLVLPLLAVACGREEREDATTREPAAAPQTQASAAPPAAKPARAPAPARFRFVRRPVLQFDGEWFRTTVRMNGPLPGGNAPRASIDVAGAAPDIPGLEPSLGVRRCYEQENFLLNKRRPPREGALVAVTLTIRGRPKQVLRARLPVELVSRAAEPRGKVLRRLGCPRRSRELRCTGSADGELSIAVEAAGGGATCATAQQVMDEVATWADSGRCFEDLCVREHRMNAGFRCTVAKVGEADWAITCSRGRLFVRGSTAE